MKRKQYDAYGSAGFDPGTSSSGQGYWRGGPSVDPEELFRKIFGEFSSSPFGDFQNVFDQPQEVRFLFFIFVFFERGSYILALAVLELTLQTRLALNSQRSAYLCLPSARIKDTCHHTQCSLF